MKNKRSLKIANWIILVILVAGITFLAFYNLDINPRPWHDEGAAMTVAKTLANDGVYAVKNSDGYQTFGPIQSIGPTVLLPVALCFKVLGVGLFQGRVVAAVYLIVALLLFYIIGFQLFNKYAALISIFFLLSSPGAGILLFGREVLGDIPALACFLGGWLIWSKGVITQKSWFHLISGLLFGAAMVTKSQYILMGFGSIFLIVLLDLFYYKQGVYKYLIIIGIISFTCVAGWWIWQAAYFGLDTFKENLDKLSALAKSTTGLKYKINY